MALTKVIGAGLGTLTDNADFDGTLNVQGETTLQTHLNMGDSDEIKIGAGVDLKVFSDGTNGVLRADNGRVYIQTDTGVNLTKTGNAETMLIATPDGAVDLYHNNAKKFETTSTGVNITGAVNIGGTGTANALDDYEEGTWTLAQGGQGTWSSPTIVGKYTKIGQMVRVQIEQTAGTISYQKTHFSGLPFAVNGHAYKGIGGATNGALDNLGNIVAYSGTTLIYPLTGGSTQTNLIFSITYFTDS